MAALLARLNPIKNLWHLVKKKLKKLYSKLFLDRVSEIDIELFRDRICYLLKHREMVTLLPQRAWVQFQETGTGDIFVTSQGPVREMEL